MKTYLLRLPIVMLSVFFCASIGFAHITPPVVLMSDRDAVIALTLGARRFFVREARLAETDMAAIQKQWRWRPEEPFYRFYLGRDDRGRLVSAVVFLTEYTIHGPVRVAVGIGPDGKVRGALVVELTEETYPWLRPLLDQNLAQDYIGRDSRAAFVLGSRFEKVHLGEMAHFYAQIVASLIHRGAILFEAAGLKQGG